jgi:hypothetical protein
MSRKGESVTLSLSPDDKAKLEEIALKFGCTWGDKPNLSALLKAIADKSLIIHWNDETPAPEIKRSQAKQAIEKIKQGLDELSISLEKDS